MKKIISLALAALMAVGLFAGCSRDNTSSSQGADSAQAEKPAEGAAVDSKMIAMIIPLPQGDPFITLTYSGIEQLGADKGIETKIIEALDKSEYSEQIRAMAEAGANPVYVIWDDLAAEVENVAGDFPDTDFIIIDCYAISDKANVKTIVVEPHQSAFIAGVVAGKTTESGKIAWLGSMKTPTIDRFRAGFEAGVKYAKPDAEIESLYIGDANDPNKGSELAKQVMGKGADVVMHSANKSGLGVIRAGEEMNVKIIGVDEWQGAINEDIVFWSALKDIQGAAYKAGESVLDGTFTPGMQVYDINTGINLYDQRDFDKLPAELQQEVLDVIEKIKSGEIEISDSIDGE